MNLICSFLSSVELSHEHASGERDCRHSHRELWGRDLRLCCDLFMIRIAEDVILVHVLCWKWCCVTYSLISDVLLTSMQHHVKWFYCTVKVTHVRDSQQVLKTWFTSSAGRSRTRDVRTWITFALSLTLDSRRWGRDSHSHTVLNESFERIILMNRF